MGYISNFNLFNRTLLCITASSLFLTTIPQHTFAIQKPNIGFNDLSFALRIQNLIDRFNQYKNKYDENKLLGVLLEIKTEVEGYINKNINVDEILVQIEKDIKRNGGNLRSAEMRRYRQNLNRTQKQYTHRAIYIANCVEHNLPYSSEECFQLYEAKTSKKNEDKEEVNLPIRVSIGITMALCGYFLRFVPHPLCQAASTALISAGTGLAIEGTIDRVEEDEKNNKDKKKR